MGITCVLVRKVVSSQIHLRRLSLESSFEMDGLGQMGQQRVVLGLPGLGWQRRWALNQSKVAGARYRVESRSWTVESTVQRARAFQAEQEAEADIEAGN